MLGVANPPFKHKSANEWTHTHTHALIRLLHSMVLYRFLWLWVYACACYVCCFGQSVSGDQSQSLGVRKFKNQNRIIAASQAPHWGGRLGWRLGVLSHPEVESECWCLVRCSVECFFGCLFQFGGANLDVFMCVCVCVFASAGRVVSRLVRSVGVVHER